MKVKQLAMNAKILDSADLPAKTYSELGDKH